MNGVCLIIAAAVAAAPSKPAPAKDVPDLRCGGYCLYVGLRALDFPVGSYDEIEAKLGQPSADTGYSLGQIEAAAEEFGAETLGVRTTPERLALRPGRFAAIAHVDGNHFVTVADVTEGVARVVDPPREYTLPVETLRARWDGTALLLSRDPLIAEEEISGPLPWMWVAAGGGLLALAAVAVFVLGRRKPAGGPVSGGR